MADVKISATVLERHATTFKDKETGAPVTYYEALLADSTGTLVVFRSSSAEDFAPLEVGKFVKDFACRTDKPVTVDATLCRPTRAGGQEEF